MGDHAALHVARDKRELGGHAGAERLLAAERQDRNRELALGQEGLVVEAVLRERDEPLEGFAPTPEMPEIAEAQTLLSRLT